ncbi:Clp protease ClpP [Breoghania sp. L-A4]|nr:Clp protease ClpP [Breoghania sp. L-A4]
MPVSVSPEGELVLYGFVGDNLWDEGFTAREVLDALAEAGRGTDIVVRLNSAGGYVDDGVAIYNALVAHKGHVTVQVDAIAASSASIIAMAGDDRVMLSGALMMIHDPSRATMGTAADHEKSKSILDKLAALMAGIYADVTAEDEEGLRIEMRDELWLTGEEAVARGFATSAGTAKAKAFAAFDYRTYAHAPQRLVALAKKKRWSLEEARTEAAAGAAHPRKQEIEMTEKPKAEDDAAVAKIKAEASASARSEAHARIKAITACDEAKGRAALAEHLAFETEMSADDAVKILAAASKETAATENETDVTGGTDAQAYEQRRMAAAGQGVPGQRSEKPKAFSSGEIYALRRRALKEA